MYFLFISKCPSKPKKELLWFTCSGSLHRGCWKTAPQNEISRVKKKQPKVRVQKRVNPEKCWKMWWNYEIEVLKYKRRRRPNSMSLISSLCFNLFLDSTCCWQYCPPWSLVVIACSWWLGVPQALFIFW